MDRRASRKFARLCIEKRLGRIKDAVLARQSHAAADLKLSAVFLEDARPRRDAQRIWAFSVQNQGRLIQIDLLIVLQVASRGHGREHKGAAAGVATDESGIHQANRVVVGAQARGPRLHRVPNH